MIIAKEKNTRQTRHREKGKLMYQNFTFHNIYT